MLIDGVGLISESGKIRIYFKALLRNSSAETEKNLEKPQSGQSQPRQDSNWLHSEYSSITALTLHRSASPSWKINLAREA
jgi:hypothetical protein